VISDNSNFDDFEESEEGPDLGLGEEPRSLLDYLRARRERELGRGVDSCRSLPPERFISMSLQRLLVVRLRVRCRLYELAVSVRNRYRLSE